MIYPRQVQSQKGRFAYWLFHHLYAFDIGKNRVIGRLTSFVPEAGIILLLIDRFAFKLTTLQVGMVLMFTVLLALLIGKVYMWMGLDKVENLIATERNPQMQEMYEVNCHGRRKGGR